MKILPLAILLVSTSAFAQMRAPAPPRKETPVAPAPASAKAKERATGQKPTASRRTVRTERSRKLQPSKPSNPSKPVETTSEETATPKKKRGGFFGFFKKLFGGGKKAERLEPEVAQGNQSAQPAPATPTAPAGAVGKPAPGAVADAAPSSRPKLREEAGRDPSVLRPSINPEATTSANRSSLLPATSTPPTGSVSRPSLTPPGADSGGTSPTKPQIKPVKPEGRATTPPVPSAQSPKTEKPPTKPSAAPGTPKTVKQTGVEKNTPPAGEFDKAHYLKIKREAAADAAVVELSEKLAAAAPGNDYKEAARAYSEALFSKMREIDPSQKEWFDRMEAATLRRINAGKTFVVE